MGKRGGGGLAGPPSPDPMTATIPKQLSLLLPLKIQRGVWLLWVLVKNGHKHKLCKKFLVGQIVEFAPLGVLQRGSAVRETKRGLRSKEIQGETEVCPLPLEVSCNERPGR